MADSWTYEKLQPDNAQDDEVFLERNTRSHALFLFIDRRLQNFRDSWIALSTLFFIYTFALFCAGWSAGTPRTVALNEKAPARFAISYGEREFNYSDDGTFIGKPTRERDDNWHGALRGIHIKVTKDELKRLGRLQDNSVNLDGGSEYLVMLNVYHQLHCIKNFQMALYPDFYFPQEEDTHRKDRLHHIDHCLAYLRQSLTCNVDLGVSTYEWHDDKREPVSVPMAHECVNWERLDEWAKNRAVQLTKKGMLVHPKFGPSFPEGPSVYKTEVDLRQLDERWTCDGTDTLCERKQEMAR